jgi:amino acid transporter
VSDQLTRTLRLPAVAAVSLGAMLGAGVFVLPGIAVQKAGPAAALAFVVAGLVMLPGALSLAEMGTALPVAGGPYVVIDKSMGPLLGTVAGVGVWFSIVFKAAFALAGLGFYVSHLAESAPAKTIAIAVAVALTLVNLAGSRLTGRIQSWIVVAVVGALVVFGVALVGPADPANLRPFLPKGGGSVVAAAAVLFASLAGVTKVASIGEEVHDPDRTLPRGLILPLLGVMVAYPLLTAGMVAVAGVGGIGTETPAADVGAVLWGRPGQVAMSVVAALALISLANAAILGSSRYPFAMARNALAPAALGRVSSRNGTPTRAILLTGSGMVALIAVFPLVELAKLAAGFQLVVYALVNVAPIAFRKSDVDWYRPSFRVPGYPWVQALGILGCLALLVTLGTVPLLGVALIVTGGVAWYRSFGRSRASRESAVLDALRIRENDRVITETAAAFAADGVSHPLVLARHNVSPAKAAELVHLGDLLLAPGGHLHMVRIRSGVDGGPTDLVWDRILGSADAAPRSTLTMDDDRTREEVVGHIRTIGIDLLLAELPPDTRRSGHFIDDARWIADHAGCDTAFLRYRGLDDIRSIAILGSGGPADVVKIPLTARIAAREQARVRMVHVVDDVAADEQLAFIDDYQRRLAATSPHPIESVVVRSASLMTGIRETVGTGTDLVVIGAPLEATTGFGLADRIMESIDTPVLVIGVRDYERRTWRRRALQRVMY